MITSHFFTRSPLLRKLKFNSCVDRYTLLLFMSCFLSRNLDMLKIPCRLSSFPKNDMEQRSVSIHFQVPTAAVIRQVSPQMTLKEESYNNLSSPHCSLKSDFPSFDHNKQSQYFLAEILTVKNKRTSYTIILSLGI